ncbi:M48 family metallopeptidase [Granulosicoccaceae sp. 1_MG-2023]|nr:M48 family metallopeptidase [Granulosicoccaceae sp. 1_MG-2023]
MLKTRPALLATLAVTGLYACAVSPTGQHQLKLFPDSQMAEMGVSAYAEMKQSTPASSDPVVSGYVNCVANAITSALDSQTSWEVTVFEDEQVNAFALPGGKIGVYTGLLEVAENQDQLATVIGHEVAHVLADHGNARVSATYATQAGLALATIIGVATIDDPNKRQLLGLLGVGAQVGLLLPYGRSQETEADIVGLDLMAKAGFDPRESVPLWQNMAAAGSGGTPEFLSTHPSNERRIENLSAEIPGAMELREKARAAGRRPDCRA